MIKKPRPTSPSQLGMPQQQVVSWEDIIGKNLMRGDYNPLRGVVGMTEDYNAALTGYRQTPTGLEQEPGFARALTLMSPGTGGGPSKVAAAGVLRLPSSLTKTGYARVLKNPTIKQAKDFLEKTKLKETRTVFDPNTKDLYVFDASESTHFFVARQLGLDVDELSKLRGPDFDHLFGVQSRKSQLDNLYKKIGRKTD